MSFAASQRETLDQALAWAVWRDESWVEAIGRGSEAFWPLYKRALLYDNRASGTRGAEPGELLRSLSAKLLKMGENESTPIARAVRHRTRARVKSLSRPARVGKPGDLYRACADSEVEATGRFERGRMETIPAEEWINGHPSPKWSDITFDARKVRTALPPVDDNGERSGLRPAPRDKIDAAITAIYDGAAANGSKPPNIKELPVPVRSYLKSKGYEASGRDIMKIGSSSRHKSRRRDRGLTLRSEQRSK